MYKMFQIMEWKLKIHVLLWTVIILLEIILTCGEETVLEDNNVMEHRGLLFSTQDVAEEGRKKKKKKYIKYLIPMIFGAILVKSIILPIVLKGLAVLSSKAVTLSIISLLVATIFGVKRHSRSDKEEVVDIHVPIKYGHGHGYKKYDEEEEHEDYHYHHHPYDYKRTIKAHRRRKR